MNDDELKQLWQQQPLRDPPSAAQLMSAMQSKTSQLRRIVDARDFREVLVCAVMMIVFGFFAYYEDAPIARLGDLMVIGSLIFIAWKLIYTRRSTPPAPPGATLVESLRAELNAVRAQSRLLGSVLWWYLLPGLIGLLVGTWGGRIDPYTKTFCTLFYFAIYAFVYWLNQWARSRQLLPVEGQLESLIHSAETGEPFDQTHAANLRPIVLSMAAADRVKPAEFKVAFWQIGIYGVAGILGIGVGLSVSFAFLNATVETFPQTVRPEETNRYSVVAQKVIDRLNAGDYAGAQKLYNPEMDQAFPPRTASEFYAGLATRFGAIESFDGPTGRSGEWVGFRLHCQRGELMMKLALDANDQISGIFFRGVPKWLALSRIFSWQHPVWIVPFFLAGLLYSWLMQKLTKRAVGISALGIHLHKGQNLLLWDEIKEIRPFRTLNICSLRLIRESGEKTILPWTSLERQSDLKAAVEAFAPANHPIRKYLSLLTRIQPK